MCLCRLCGPTAPGAAGATELSKKQVWEGATEGGAPSCSTLVSQEAPKMWGSLGPTLEAPHLLCGLRVGLFPPHSAPLLFPGPSLIYKVFIAK